MRHRQQASKRPDHHAIRAAAAVLLMVPVVALVYLEAVARRLAPARPALVVAGLLAGSLVVAGMTAEPTGAGAPSPRPAAMAGDFRAVPNAPTAQPSVRPTARPAATPGPAATTPVAVASSTPTPAAPAVVRFRPRGGWTSVSRFTAVSVRFTVPMDRASTERAFRAVVEGHRLLGSVRWAEGDTVLVLRPTARLPYGASVELSVGASARSAQGMPLQDAKGIRFTVERRQPAVRPPAAPRPAPASQPALRPAAATTRWRWPLLGRITQRFGEYATRYGFHQGIDIDGDLGDRVRAARTGRIVVAGHYDECGGLQVHIDHGNGVESWYRHLSRIDVTMGARVAAGTVIGRVGNTGCSLGTHLHFGLRIGSKFVDPLRYLPPRP